MPKDPSPRPDAYIVAVSDKAVAGVTALAATLRSAGLHTRFSYKATRNLGKLLKDAAVAQARYVVILDDEVEKGFVGVKNLSNGQQSQVAVDQLPQALSKGD